MPITQEERAALARAALAEVTDPADIGDVESVEEAEPGVIDVRFACTLSAYAGWHWTVSTSDLVDVEPTVIEVELLPGDGALLAPPWLPWTERLAEWRRLHPDEEHPEELVPAEDLEDEADAEDADVDEDDLAVDDELDELDEAELEDVAAPEELEQDAGDISDEDDALDDDPEDEWVVPSTPPRR